MDTAALTLALLLLAGGLGLLANRIREGFIAVGLGIIIFSLLINNPIAWGYTLVGAGIIPIGLKLWKKNGS